MSLSTLIDIALDRGAPRPAGVPRRRWHRAVRRWARTHHLPARMLLAPVPRTVFGFYGGVL
jgi:hypothetical protein